MPHEEGYGGDPTGKEVEATAIQSMAAPQEAHAYFAAAEKRDYSLAELQQHDGSNPGVPILVCLLGKIFDVSSRADIYGIGGPYSWLAGKDGSVQLATMKKDTEVKFEDITEDQKKVLSDWVAVYERKYEFVGMLTKEEHLFI